jgi:hypothetical protein
MRPVHNSVDTVNAAAAAIVSAGSRTQPTVEPVRDSIYVSLCEFTVVHVAAISYDLRGPFSYSFALMILLLRQG